MLSNVVSDVRMSPDVSASRKDVHLPLGLDSAFPAVTASKQSPRVIPCVLRSHLHLVFAPNFAHRLESRKSCWTFLASKGLFAPPGRITLQLHEERVDV